MTIFWFLSLLLAFCLQPEEAKQCNWTGSGLQTSASISSSSPDGRANVGVIPIYLQCYQGKVSWSYPRGGLRVLLYLGDSLRKDFRGCIKVNTTFAGARIFLEGPGSLRQLIAPDDGVPLKLARCFDSVDGQIALYVEAVSSLNSYEDVFPKQVAEFMYDLEPTKRSIAFAADSECRPCDKEDMLQAYCTSDLVVTGAIDDVKNQDNWDVSEIKIDVTKFLRRNYVVDDLTSTADAAVAADNTVNDVFNRNNNNDDEYDDDDRNNNVAGNRRNKMKKTMTNNNIAVVSLYIAKSCQSKVGYGQFVFMARKKLGDFKLLCAPRLHDWKRLVTEENSRSNSQCILAY